MSVNSIIQIYTQCFSTQSMSSRMDSTNSGDQTPSQLPKSTKNPSTVTRLFPSLHTLSALSSIRDSSRYSGKMTTHFEDDVGIMALDSAHIGHGAQFDVRRVKLCCNRGFYVLKSVLSAAYEYSSQGKWENKQKREEAEQRMIQAVFLEYRALSHRPIRDQPNIVDLLDLGWETDPENGRNKWPVLILEYADQGTMTTFFKQSQFSLETRTKLCLDVARGLTILHTCGIIHGDLNMDNVLIFTNPSVDSGSINKYTAKLADFGASLVAIDGTRSRSYTVPWNAPEYLEILDPEGLKRMDVYSFGLLCWAAVLHGKNPFRVVDTVAQRLVPNEWHSPLEALKKADDGSELLRLAQDSFAKAFGHLKPPVAAITATLQLDPAKRDLHKALDVLAEFLEPLKTDDEASSGQPNLGAFDGPEICSHSVFLNSNELLRYHGPLKMYLTEWLQEPRDSSIAEEDSYEEDDKLARSLLAELEIDDWLEGRSKDPAKAIEHYRAKRSLHPWESCLLNRLASVLPQDEFNGVVTHEVRKALSEAFYSGFSPAQKDMFLLDPKWATDHIDYALVSGSGLLSGPLSWTLYKTLTDADHPNVYSVLRQAFGGLEWEISSEANSRFATSILDQSTGDSAIHIVSQVGAVNLLDQLLQNPEVDLNARNKELETPLMLACRAGRFSTAMLLIERGADVSLQNVFDENPLHWLSSFWLSPEQVGELARAVLSKGSPDLLTVEAKHRETRDFPEHRLFPGTPICRAIIKGCAKAAITLWEMEAESFALARPAYNAIAYAAKLNNSYLLDAFLEGPDDLVDPKSNLSLLYDAAIQKGSLSDSPIGRILRHGVRCRQSGVETIKVLCKYGAEEHFTSIPGLPDCNILSLAVCQYAPEVVEFLLKEMNCARFVNVNTPPPSISLAAARGHDIKYGIEAWKSPPLYHAIPKDRPLVFKLLLKYGADVNQVLGSEDGPLTMLHHSVNMTREPSFVKMLLETGKIVDVDHAEPNFESPFGTAVRMRKFDIAGCLLAHGANVNHLAINGIRSFPENSPAMTVLGRVLQNKSSLSVLACVSFLLETKRASPYAHRELNHTVLHTLTIGDGESNHMLERKMFSLLHAEFHFSKQILNARNHNGCTALELAVWNNKPALVEELILAGADWDTVLPNPMGVDSPLVSAMKCMYHFPRGVEVEGNCPPKEKQLNLAFSRRRQICLILCRKAREKSQELEMSPVIQEQDQ
ncbi:hypothetical protein P154DRAFT_605187 [Amniculicola lignicola CBS 123094]|uniref:Protein kinase domain-containing protein n=1 Tax=Amniculicola lignicola CBS 123094 TaxID=1392246 RepID=A0A6A5WEX4_9PLEO|nr:hypothetical protein P154DRAFT_605187 [Amniculicola lignicola CBS 123094]